MKKIFYMFFVGVVSLVPVAMVSAATNYAFPADKGISDVIMWAISIMNLLIYLIIGFAVVTFLWGIAQTIWHGDDAEARKKGRDLMIYGIIGLAVMLGFWSIVLFVGRSFGLNSTGIVPQFNPQTGTVSGGAGSNIQGSLSSPATSNSDTSGSNNANYTPPDSAADSSAGGASQADLNAGNGLNADGTGDNSIAPDQSVDQSASQSDQTPELEASQSGGAFDWEAWCNSNPGACPSSSGSASF